MKKILAILLAVFLAASFAAFGQAQPAPAAPAPAPADPAPAAPAPAPADPAPAAPAAPAGDTFELALITDLGTIDDKSFNQGAWEGLVQYAQENNITHKYYQPTEQSDDAYLNAIDLAVTGGAKLIVTPGFLFEVPIYIAQERYPDVHFVLLDGVPHNADYSDYRTDANAVGVNYAEHEAGFLAGYAAVKDGSTKLGFVGGMAVPAVVRFGYGFVQGAEYAADELGLGAGSVSLNYHYTGGFDATPEAQALAASWYNSGAEVIFACGGAVGNSVMAAAEQANAKVIGVDVDQSGESATVITSATKGLSASVYSCIKDYYAGTFPGGQTQIFSAANDGVGLPMASSKFSTFAQADYDAIFAKLADGSVTMVSEITEDGSPMGLPVDAVVITEVK
jgi:basic membrane protein A